MGRLNYFIQTTIGTRNFSSALRLRDGETQILGGLISDEDRTSASRVPLLGELPFLGRLFSNQSDNRQRTEIVLSITPHLIRNIQRASPALESFWSGTETQLKNKTTMLRKSDLADTANLTPTKATPQNQTPQVTSQAGPTSPKLYWSGAAKAKKGEVQTLELEIESSSVLRAASTQLAYKPNDVEIISVKDGEFFGKNAKGNFGHSIDQASGRISIGQGNSEGVQSNGKTKLLSLTYKVIRDAGETDFSVISMSPIGVSQTVDRPALPLNVRVKIE